MNEILNYQNEIMLLIGFGLICYFFKRQKSDMPLIAERDISKNLRDELKQKNKELIKLKDDSSDIGKIIKRLAPEQGSEYFTYLEDIKNDISKLKTEQTELSQENQDLKEENKRLRAERSSLKFEIDTELTKLYHTEIDNINKMMDIAKQGTTERKVRTRKSLEEKINDINNFYSK